MSSEEDTESRPVISAVIQHMDLKSVVRWLQQQDQTDCKTLLLLDDGFAEMLKWENEFIVSDFPVLPLPLTTESRNIARLYKPDRLVCFLSATLDTLGSALQNLREILCSGEFILVTTSTQELLSPTDRDTTQISDFLDTVDAQVIHCPRFGVNLLSAERDKVGMYVLSSPSCRRVCPVTSHRVSCKTTSLSSNSMNSNVLHVTAEDLPVDDRRSLKFLSHQLAGALVRDLALDTTCSVFALGKTASLVGHTIQPVLDTLVQDSSPDSLSPATLVLVDRTIDLFTPISHCAGAPLAHRILATVPRQSSAPSAAPVLDIALPQPAHLVPTSSIAMAYPEQSPLLYPLSAVSTLPFRVAPSIVPPKENKELMRSAISGSEETGRKVLCEVLSSRVIAEGGTLPPAKKKRGVGAEVLGLVTSLIQADGEGRAVCLRAQGLLAWSCAVIDAMQRSSTKQLMAHMQQCKDNNGSTVSSYDTRATSEAAVLNLLREQLGLGLLSPGVLAEIVLDQCGIKPGGSAVDLKHAFLVILGVFSLVDCLCKTSAMEYREQCLGAISTIAKAMAAHVLETGGRGAEVLMIFSKELLADIREFYVQTKEGNLVELEDFETTKMRLLLEMGDIITSSLDILIEVADMRSSLLRASADPSLTSSLSHYDDDGLLSLLEVHKDGPPPVGVVGRIAGALFRERRNIIIRGKHNSALPLLNFIENPIYSLARAGIGMLSHSLGRLGLSSTNMSGVHPSSKSTIVIFVIGGASILEVKQIQEQLELANTDGTDTDTRIILASNDIVSPDDMFHFGFRRMSGLDIS